MDSLWEEKTNYYIFQIFVNPRAREEILKYEKVSEWVDGGKRGNSSLRIFKKKSSDSRAKFYPSLRKTYENAFEKILKSKIGQEQFSLFSIVDEKVNGGWPHWANMDWPKNIIIKDVGENLKIFEETLSDLNEEEIYKALQEIEHPQNYNLAEIDLLRKKKINPFILDDKNMKISSENLRDFMNFLIPFKIYYEDRNPFEGF